MSQLPNVTAIPQLNNLRFNDNKLIFFPQQFGQVIPTNYLIFSYIFVRLF